MSVSRTLICAFVAASALAAAATEPSAGVRNGEPLARKEPASPADPLVERYSQLADQIGDFDNFTDAEINDAVFAGIHSENPKVVELTLTALSWEALGWSIRRAQVHPVATKERDFGSVPGLRDFLIAHARREFVEHGWEGVDDLDLGVIFGEHVWRFAFVILVEFYPQDPDVYALLDESYRDQDWPINLLNTGLYFHEAADQVRIAALAGPEHLATEAAKGLARSGSAQGVDALRRSLWRRDAALPAIAEALVSLRPSAAADLRRLGMDDGALAPDLREHIALLAGQAELVLGEETAHGDLVVPRRAAQAVPATPAAEPAPRRELSVDPDGVPLVANPWDVEMPLDHALQLYERYTDAQVTTAIAAGIGSGDARIVEQTVLVLGTYSMLVALRDWPVFGLEQGDVLREVADPRTRNLDKVPGLRGFLIDYAGAGMNVDACRALGKLGPKAPRPAWMKALTPLAVFFPGQADVERLLLRFGECLDRAGVDQSILPLLGIGRFRSDAVVRWHIDKLPHPHPTKARWAARGLARFLTDGGLAALVANLSRQDEALADIVEAVATHGFRATPHLAKLAALEGRSGALPEEARRRIASATAKIAKLATLRHAAGD